MKSKAQQHFFSSFIVESRASEFYFPYKLISGPY